MYVLYIAFHTFSCVEDIDANFIYCPRMLLLQIAPGYTLKILYIYIYKIVKTRKFDLGIRLVQGVIMVSDVIPVTSQTRRTNRSHRCLRYHIFDVIIQGRLSVSPCDFWCHLYDITNLAHQSESWSLTSFI